jgi:transposase InsO family protein
MADRSSGPHCCPRRTPQPVVRKVIHLRWKQRLGPVAIAGRVGLAPSTVHRILVSCRVNRLWHVDRATGEPIRRYEADRPGELVHIDIKKLGNIPDGGGWRALGHTHGRAHTQAHRGRPRKVPGRANIGYCYVHSAVDSHTRLAYSEALDDETAVTAIAFLERAGAYFADHGIDHIDRILTDNGSAYRSHAWRDHLASHRIRHSRTRVRRPQTNGKVERFNRTLLQEWAYRRLYRCEQSRRSALTPWLHHYNHHRHHTALGGPPISRCTNVSDQYS